MSDCVLEDCGSATIGKCMETDQNYFFCMEEMLIPQCDICINSVWVLFDFNSAILLGGGGQICEKYVPSTCYIFLSSPPPPP